MTVADDARAGRGAAGFFDRAGAQAREMAWTDRAVEAVVFDCDGVIADTVGVWDITFSTVASRHGLHLGPDRLSRLHGAAIRPGAERLADWLGGAVAANSLADELDEELFSSLGTAPLEPVDGLPRLLDSLSGVVSIAVASNAPRRAVLRVVGRLGITQHFSVVICADDVAQTKPAPDPYLAACAAMGLDPYGSLAIEDSEIGALSADAAGLRVVELGAGSWKQNGNAMEGQPRRPGALRTASLGDPCLISLVLRGHI